MPAPGPADRWGLTPGGRRRRRAHRWARMLVGLAVAAVALTVAGALQVLLPPWPLLAEAKCPVLTAVALYYGQREGNDPALLVALAAGVLTDVHSPLPLGTTSAVLALIVLAVWRIPPGLLREVPTVAVLLGGAAGAATAIGQGVVLTLSGDGRPPLLAVALKAVGTGVLAAVATPFVFATMRGLDRLQALAFEGGNET